MKIVLFAAILFAAPTFSRAAAIDPYLNVLKKLGLIADSTTGFEARACSGSVAICLNTLSRVAQGKMGGEAAKIAEELSEQAVTGIDKAIRLKPGFSIRVNGSTLQRKSLDDVLQSIDFRAGPTNTQTLAVVAKLWKMEAKELQSLPLITILNTIEILQNDQLVEGAALIPEAFKSISDSLLALAIAKQAAQNTPGGLARLKVIVAENRLFSEAMAEGKIAIATDENIREISDLLSDLDMAQVRWSLREKAFEKVANIFAALEPKVGQEISLESYSRLLLSLSDSMFKLNGSYNGRNTFLYHLTLNLSLVAKRNPEILDNPAVFNFIHTKHDFPHPDVDFQWE